MKEQTKHTPGPWVLDKYKNGSFDVVKNGFVVCSREPINHRTEESMSNARLIATAPELLSHLKALVAIFDPDRQGIYNFARPSIQEAQEVITKAEGTK